MSRARPIPTAAPELEKCRGSGLGYPVLNLRSVQSPFVEEKEAPVRQNSSCLEAREEAGIQGGEVRGPEMELQYLGHYAASLCLC